MCQSFLKCTESNLNHWGDAKVKHNVLSDILEGQSRQETSVFTILSKMKHTHFSIYSNGQRSVEPRSPSPHWFLKEVTEPMQVWLLVHGRQCLTAMRALGSHNRGRNTILNRGESHWWEQKSLRDWAEMLKQYQKMWACDTKTNRKQKTKVHIPLRFHAFRNSWEHQI